MMKTLKNLSLALLCLGGIGEVRAAAEQFCTSSYLSSCASLSDEACLIKYHACGEYDAIIQHFAAEDSSSLAVARYFKGVSYHGLYVRNRAKSLQCQFAKLARTELAAYLYLMKDKGLQNPVDFDRVYLASKIIDGLRTVTGCLENGVTEDEIRFRVADYADKRLKSLFIGGSSDDALGMAIQNTKSNLQTTISGFVTKAVKLETQVELRATALVASQERLGLIAKAFDEALGTTSITRNGKGDVNGLGFQLDASRGLIQAQNKSGAWREKVGSVERELLAAFDGMNINDYEKARQNFVIRGRYTRDEATSHLNLNTRITQPSALASIKTEIQNPLDANGPAAAISRIEKSLRESANGAAECAFYSPWFCQETNEMMRAIPNTGAFP
ncbi:hypothetical protein [Oligoflexus tunisiensis]|uniref:hypothetical protein n=1 Tax=Oligoflexus tunisiensis TaxID=708132 RepID=UPI00114CD021|nr:hypothetical protein [Oligoflexus tunisiensis]